MPESIRLCQYWKKHMQRDYYEKGGRKVPTIYSKDLY